MPKAFKGGQPNTPILRGDYQAPAWFVESIELVIQLDPSDTRVRAVLTVTNHTVTGSSTPALQLNGVGLDTGRVLVNDQAVDPSRLDWTDETLTISDLPDHARITTEVRFAPNNNLALEGLYVSGSSMLTQCEAEGFRKITWFPDRPDIMTRFRVRLEAEQARYPILLCNGNLVHAGSLGEGRHFAEWDDPIPKPSYLFALVAGQLGLIEDTFTTASGRTVALKIYSEHDNLDQLDHAMTSLKHSMAWDEQRYGLEYDLDVYHIVATHDFNMGAMENKSLNIFNARFVLADPDTATDADYEGIESVIAHEYFHNWTGNRVTCRDWFQLTLKEGLTVFRDQEFSADMQSKAVTRIQHVNTLLNRQFLEDAGPMAHSIRPQRYVEINNFYTATVYEKGAEIIRMYQTLLGREGFRRGMDLYFERHDGQAVTCDDFLAAMADANRVDLDQFGRWYSQVGTPRLAVRAEWSEIEKSLTLEFEQSLMAHPDNASIGPLHIPIRIGFLTREGAAMAVPLADHSQAASEHLIELKSVIEVVRFTGFSERPVVSLLRDFSAPVLLDYDWSEAELALLLAHDRDPVARWLAGKRLAATVLEQAVVDVQQARAVSAPTALIDALDAVLLQAEDDPALAAELLQLPSETELAQRIQPVDVGAIHRARKQIVQHLVAGLQPALLRCYERCVDQSPWAFKAEDVGRRRLANRCLTWLVMSGLEVGQTLALEQIQSADNLTNRLAALQALVHQNSRYADEQLHAFEQRYSDNALVMDKWFSVQATQPDPSVVERLHELIQHPSFSLKNPNKARALIGSFGQNNPIAFHRNDAAGYALVADMVCALDRMNPQVAARIVAVFNHWSDYVEPHRSQMKAALQQILATPELSRDVAEIVRAALADHTPSR